MALTDLSVPVLRQRALAMGMSQAHVNTAHTAKQLAFMIKNYQPAPPPPPQAPPPPKPVAPVKPPLRISKGNVGVRQNKKKKSKANSLSIARSANVIPLQQGAVGYQGLRIS